MKKAFEKIRELLKRNATHRRGHKIGEQTPEGHLKYAAGEMIELAATSGLHEDLELSELADVFNCLGFYAGSRGFTEDQIGAAMLEKLRTRFLEETKQ